MPTTPKRRFSNQAQVEKFIFDHVNLNCDQSAWEVLRDPQYDGEFHHILDNPSVKNKRAWIDQVENKWEANIKEAEWRGQLAIDYLQQMVAEVGLVGDLLAEFDSLELDNPADVRDAVQLAQRVGQKASEYGIRDAVVLLEEVKHPGVNLLRARFEVLYPPALDDEDESAG